MSFGRAHYQCKIGIPYVVGQHMLTVDDIQMVYTSGLLSCKGNKGENLRLL